MNPLSDVIIVGAGIVGASCARSLAREGIRVTIVDATTIGDGATAAGMGHVTVMEDNPAQLALTAYSTRLWQELAPTLPADCQFDPCGTLWVAADEEEMAAAREKEQTLRAHGVAAELLDARQLAEAEPQLRPGLAGGLLMPGDLVVYPPCVARWLIDRAREQRAEVRLGCKVISLGGDYVQLADGTRLTAGTVVNAAGAAVPQLVPGVPIRPRKGHLAITERYAGFLHHEVIELGYIKSAAGNAAESVAMNVQPRRTGQVLIGSSRQFSSESSGIEVADPAADALPGDRIPARFGAVDRGADLDRLSRRERRQPAANWSLAASGRLVSGRWTRRPGNLHGIGDRGTTDGYAYRTEVEYPTRAILAGEIREVTVNG